jgi:hypothetical protein
MACANGSGIAPGLSGRSACATVSRWLVEGRQHARRERREREPGFVVQH